MNAGSLKFPILIQQLVNVKNGYGATDIEYADYLNTKCNIKNDGGNREIQNNEIFHSSTVTFYVRNYHIINETMRIIIKGKKYRIISICTDDFKMMTEIKSELINE